MTPRMTLRDIEDRVRQIPVPAPSASLRERVMATALVTAQPLTWSDRLWFSRAWRLTAAMAVLAIVVLDQLASVPRRPGFTVSAQVIAEAQVIEETGRQVGLPADVAASLARRAISDQSRSQRRAQSASELLEEFAARGGGDWR